MKLASLLVIVLLEPFAVMAKKKKKKGGPAPKPWGGAILSRCSACSAVASDILKKQEAVARPGKVMTELQSIEVLEDDKLGHFCNRMKLDWHYLTM